MRKSVETKDRVKESPLAWKVLGGALGVGLASLLSKKYTERRELREYGWDEAYLPPRQSVGYAGADVMPSVTVRSYETAVPTAGVYAEPIEGERWSGQGLRENLEPGLKEKASAKAADLKDKAADLKGRATGAVADKADELKDRAADLGHRAHDRLDSMKAGASDRVDSLKGKAHDLSERLPSREELGQKASATWQRGVQDEPLAILFGAIALGAAASFLLPVSDAERRALGPYRSKVRSKLDEVKSEAASRLEEVRGQALSALEQVKGQAQDLKGQAIDTLKGQQSQGDSSTGFQASASPTGINTDGLSSAPRDEAFRSTGLVQRSESDQPTEKIGSYDSKLPH